MREQSIIDSNLTASLSALFDQTCTIQEDQGATADELGQPVADWQDLAGHVNLACRVTPAASLLRRGFVPGPEMTVSTATHVFALPGPHPDVSAGMRVAYDGGHYLIVSVVRDSEQVLAELWAEAVTT